MTPSPTSGRGDFNSHLPLGGRWCLHSLSRPAGEGWGEGGSRSEMLNHHRIIWITGTVSVQFGTSATMAAGQTLLDRISYAIQNSVRRRI